MKTIIYLVRHGESEHNVNDIISGQVNPQLTARGREQAKNKRHNFKDVQFDAVYTSDLDRAVHTAELLVDDKVHPDNKLAALRELSYGSFEGKHAIRLAPGSAKKVLLSDDKKWHYKHVPDMESDHEVVERYVSALRELAEKHKGQTILIVTHGTAIRNTMRKLLDLSYAHFPSGSFKNTDHAILEYEDGVFTVVETPGGTI